MINFVHRSLRWFPIAATVSNRCDAMGNIASQRYSLRRQNVSANMCIATTLTCRGDALMSQRLRSLRRFYVAAIEVVATIALVPTESERSVFITLRSDSIGAKRNE